MRLRRVPAKRPQRSASAVIGGRFGESASFKGRPGSSPLRPFPRALRSTGASSSRRPPLFELTFQSSCACFVVRSPPLSCHLTLLASPDQAHAGLPFRTLTQETAVVTHSFSTWYSAVGFNVSVSVSYTHLRAHETDSYLVCRL